MNEQAHTRLVDDNDFDVVCSFVTLLAKALEGDGVPFVEGLSKELYATFIKRERGCAILAESGTGPLGLITVSFNLSLRHAGEYAQVEELIVNEAARGKHIGSTLIKAAIKAARQRGCAEIGLFAVERNRPFYEKMGFVYAGPELRMSLAADAGAQSNEN